MLLTGCLLFPLLVIPVFSARVPLCQFTVEAFVSSLSTDESILQQVSLLDSHLKGRKFLLADLRLTAGL